jgi:hypothetical protein
MQKQKEGGPNQQHPAPSIPLPLLNKETYFFLQFQLFTGSHALTSIRKVRNSDDMLDWINDAHLCNLLHKFVLVYASTRVSVFCQAFDITLTAYFTLFRKGRKTKIINMHHFTDSWLQKYIRPILKIYGKNKKCLHIQ